MDNPEKLSNRVHKTKFTILMVCVIILSVHGVMMSYTETINAGILPFIFITLHLRNMFEVMK